MPCELVDTSCTIRSIRTMSLFSLGPKKHHYQCRESCGTRETTIKKTHGIVTKQCSDRNVRCRVHVEGSMMKMGNGRDAERHGGWMLSKRVFGGLPWRWGMQNETWNDDRGCRTGCRAGRNGGRYEDREERECEMDSVPVNGKKKNKHKNRNVSGNDEQKSAVKVKDDECVTGTTKGKSKAGTNLSSSIADATTKQEGASKFSIDTKNSLQKTTKTTTETDEVKNGTVFGEYSGTLISQGKPIGGKRNPHLQAMKSNATRSSLKVHDLLAAAKRENSPRKKIKLLDEAIQCSDNDIDRAFALVAKGSFEMRGGDFDAAEDLLQQAIDVCPNQPAPWNALGKLSERRRDQKTAEKMFAEALNIDPNHSPSLHSLALISARSSNYKNAEKYFRRASEISPRDPKIWQAWALMEWRDRGRYFEAKELFERGIECCLPHAPLYIAYASCEASRRGRTKARALLRQALSIDQNEPRAYVLLAQLEGRSNNQSTAIDVCRKGLQNCPGNVYLLCTLGQIYAACGDAKNASLAWSEALQQDPNCAVAAHELGLEAQRDGRFKEAENLLRSGMESTKDRTGSLRCGATLAELYYFLGDKNQARQTMHDAGSRHGIDVSNKKGMRYRKSDSGSSADGRFLRSWAALEKRMGNYDTASKLFRQATLAAPSNERTWLQYGLLERRRGELMAAIKCFKAGLKVSPLNPHLWMMLGSTLWECGLQNESRDVYKEGIKKCPNNQQLLLDYGMNELKSGHMETALHIFRKAHNLTPPHGPLFHAWASTARQLGFDKEAHEVEERLSSPTLHSSNR